MNQKICLIADDMHQSIFSLIKQIGWKYDYRPDISREEIREQLKNYQGLIIRSKTKVDEDLIGSNSSLKFIGRAGAGLDNVDVAYLSRVNIPVLHAAEGNRDAVAEYTIGALLSLLRNIPKADAEVRKSIWDREGNRGEEIMGKTIGIIGYGNMGRAFAQRLSGFGCKVLAYDKYKSDFTDNICRAVSMEKIFEETDILSFHIPLTSETRFMADNAYFNRFRKNIIFVNTARGEIVSLSALESGLASGKIRGAVLDVLENEKINKLTPSQQQSFNNLITRSNVIFTPHIAGWTFESHEKINVALVSKIKSLGL